MKPTAVFNCRHARSPLTWLPVALIALVCSAGLVCTGKDSDPRQQQQPVPGRRQQSAAARQSGSENGEAAGPAGRAADSTVRAKRSSRTGGGEATAGKDATAGGGMRVVTSATHLQSLIRDSSDDKVLMVEMYADWCRPCKLLEPKLKKLSHTHADKMRLYKIDVEKHRDIARTYRVRAIPNVLVFENGEKKKQIPGLRPVMVYEREILR
jgi:thioredoxin 1